MTELDKKTIEELSPGIRDLVVFLNKHGFATCDSGDGSNAKEGMECAWPEPMVGIQIKDPAFLTTEANRLKWLLTEAGVKFPEHLTETSPAITATYNPVDRTAIIVLVNVLSSDVNMSEKPTKENP